MVVGGKSFQWHRHPVQEDPFKWLDSSSSNKDCLKTHMIDKIWPVIIHLSCQVCQWMKLKYFGGKARENWLPREVVTREVL